jgi:hypothetical protein
LKTSPTRKTYLLLSGNKERDPAATTEKLSEWDGLLKLSRADSRLAAKQAIRTARIWWGNQAAKRRLTRNLRERDRHGARLPREKWVRNRILAGGSRIKIRTGMNPERREQEATTEKEKSKLGPGKITTPTEWTQSKKLCLGDFHKHRIRSGNRKLRKIKWWKTHSSNEIKRNNFSIEVQQDYNRFTRSLSSLPLLIIRMKI